MIDDQYIWLIWSSAFLLPWGLVYWFFAQYRHTMLWASLFTMPFGLTEPLFVPEYWSPPSLFDLAANTGFDIESLIFCFAIGGIGAVLYNLVTRHQLRAVDEEERLKPLHRHHYKALATPFVAFPLIYLSTDWNPIYPAIVAMVLGAFANILCRPDLKKNTWFGGILFLLYYIIFLTGLEITAPDYIERVWNVDALSGLFVAFMPMEELLFAFAFGTYWAGVYEHVTWRK